LPEEEALPPLAVVVVVVVPAAAAFLLRAEESRRWASTSPRVLRVEREREKDRGVREEVVEEKRAKKNEIERREGRRNFLSSSLPLCAYHSAVLVTTCVASGLRRSASS
jgi:hypothetical protein